ncbi:MAG: response regulator transcription factor [Ignavibacteriota bacterium]
MENIKSIIIADDHPIFRNGLKQILLTNDKIKLLGEAANGEEALNLIVNLKPDVAVLDLDMPVLNGLEILEKLKTLKTDTKIIMLTMFKEEKMFNKAFDKGAYAYVLKDSAVEDIIGCIESVSSGNYFISPALSSFLISRSKKQKEFEENFKDINSLTDMERKVLKLVSQSKSSKDISNELFVSSRTVDKHRENISKKLDIRGNLSLTKFAIDNKSFL